MNTAKKTWLSPRATLEEFTPNEYVSACYKLACQAASSKYGPLGINGWDGLETGGNITHAALGTAGTCGDASANRVITDDGEVATVQEHNSAKDGQGWISGAIDHIDKPIKIGSVVYWHTFSADKQRRWNHWGYVEPTDAAHPNHS